MTRLAANFTEVLAVATRRWQLNIGPTYSPGGTCSWTAPATMASGVEAVLKIGWPHPEADDEAAGLALWNGDGVVRLVDATVINGTHALLLERCVPGTSLAQLAGPDEQDEVVAGLLRRAWRPAGLEDSFRPLQQMCNEWADDASARLVSFEAVVEGVVDRGLLSVGIELFRELAVPSVADVVLFTDLHAGNILAAQREPWLAIDPKPYVGDPAYDVLQHLLNSPRLAVDAGGLVRRMAALLDLEEQRVRHWAFARVAVHAADEPSCAGIVRQLAP